MSEQKPEMKKMTISIDEKTLKILGKMAIDYSTNKSQLIRRLVLDESKRIKEMG
jgi:Fe-S cluster assembly iron-binding protein IscA